MSSDIVLQDGDGQDIIITPSPEVDLGLQNSAAVDIDLINSGQGLPGTPGVGVPTGGTTGQVLSKIDGTDYNTQWSNPAAGSGTVTSVSVASSNGFSGTSDGNSATPTLTLGTSITGLLKGNGTAISAASAGTDYLTASSTNTLTNKTYDTAGTGNSFSINGSSVTDFTGVSGSRVVLSSSPTMTGSLTIPTVKGGVGAASVLTIQSTSGVGTSDSIAIKTGSQVTAIAIDTLQKVTLSSLTNGLVKSTSGLLSNAVSGTDYGTVSSVSVTTANGVSGSVATSTSTPAITLTLGAITPTSVNSVVLSGASTPTLAVTGTTTVSGTNTGDQTTITGNAGSATVLQTSRIIGTLTGDATSAGSTFNGSTNNTNAVVVSRINGVALSGLATGILKNTTTTGVPSIAVAGTDYQTPISLTTTGSGAATFISNVLNIPTPGSSFITSLTTTGTSGPATVTSGVLNIPQYSGGGSGSGDVTGPASATADGLATYSGTTGKIIQSATTITASGTNLNGVVSINSYTVPGSAYMGISDTQTVTNKNLTSGTNTFPTFNQNTTGSAATLTTPRLINGVSFNGSADITTPSSAVLRSVSQTAHGFVVGDIVRLTTTANTYTKSQADSASNAAVSGTVSTVTNANAFILTTEGPVTGLTGLTAGTQYFLSPTTAGAYTATDPSTPGQVSKPVFVADTTTSGVFHNYRGITVPAAGFTNPMTTQGDIIYGGASGVATRLAAGSSTTVLMGGTTPVWTAATGTGSPVLATSPTLVTPTIGVATATSVNKVTITAPTTSATLTLVTGSTLATAGAFSTTLTSTAATNVTLPTSGTLYGTATGSITSSQLATSLTDETGTGVAVFGTSPTITTPVIDQFGTASGLGAAWTTWVPTWTNVTVGNATVTARYKQIGKSVFCFISFVFGSTTSITGNVAFSLPVTAAANYSGTTTGRPMMGSLYIEDSGVQGYGAGYIQAASTTTANPGISNTAATYATNAVMNATTPFTWGLSDYFTGEFFYEAA